MRKGVKEGHRLDQEDGQKEEHKYHTGISGGAEASAPLAFGLL